MAVFGVDFGNLNSVVSTARRGGIDIITNEVSKRETSSMVSFGDKQRFLGEKALDQSMRNWKNTVGSLKRLVGVKFASEEFTHENQFLKVQTRADENGFVELLVRYKWEDQWFKPEQLIAMLFTQLKIYAELEAAIEVKAVPGSVKVQDCVVSTPIYYTATQRKLMHQALLIAGLNPLTLINETTAAALDWGIFKTGSLPEEEANAVVVAIVDVGHSAMTVSVVSYMKGQLRVLGHEYDKKLGCRDFDLGLYTHFAAEVQKKYKIDLKEEKKNAIRLMSAIDKLKKVLSANPAAPLNCEMGEYDVAFPPFSREDAEGVWAPLLVQVKELMERAKAIPGAESVSQVEIIGGGSRVPAIKSAVAEAFGQTVYTTLNASETVAKGCGIMGAMLSPKFKVREFSVIDAHPHTVNLGYHSDKTTTPITDKNFPEINKKMVVLKPGDACPKTLNLTFDRSQAFDLFVFYDESPEANTAEHLLLGKWRISNIPTFSDVQSVKVRLRLNPSMLINVEGACVTEEWEEDEVVEVPVEKKDSDKKLDDKAEPETEKKVQKKKKSKRHDCTITVLSTVGHSDAKVKEFTDMETCMIKSDLNVQETQEMKNTVESYILDMRNHIGSSGMYGEFIADADRESFLTELQTSEDWLYDDGDDAAKDDYIQKFNDLKALGNPAVLRFEAWSALNPARNACKDEVARVKALSQATDGKLDHIPGEELLSVVAKADEVMTWGLAEFAKLEGMSKTQMPTVKAADITLKCAGLKAFADPILTRPKPKEPEKPVEEPAAEPAAEEKPAEAPKPEVKMDLD